MTNALIKGENLDTDTEGHVRMKAESKVMHLQAKELQRWPESHQKLEEMHRAFSFSQPSKGTIPADAMILDFWSLEL